MRLTPRAVLALLGIALLASTGCRKAKAPEPQVAITSPQPANTLPSSGPNSPASTPAFDPTRPTQAPFTLALDPPSLKVAPGGKARVKVTANRTGYQGPIAVELQRLPGKVTAVGATIAAGETFREIEVVAATDAASGPKTDVQVVGSAASPASGTVSVPFTVDIAAKALFSLKMEPGAVKLAQGAHVKVKITTVRSGYQGSIPVELRNLPSGVDAPKAVIPQDKNEVEVELTATSSAAPATRKDVAVVSMSSQSAPISLQSGTEPQVTSPGFTVEVVKGNAFGLRVEPARASC